MQTAPFPGPRSSKAPPRKGVPGRAARRTAERREALAWNPRENLPECESALPGVAQRFGDAKPAGGFGQQPDRAEGYVLAQRNLLRADRLAGPFEDFVELLLVLAE